MKGLACHLSEVTPIFQIPEAAHSCVAELVKGECWNQVSRDRAGAATVAPRTAPQYNHFRLLGKFSLIWGSQDTVYREEANTGEEWASPGFPSQVGILKMKMTRKLTVKRHHFFLVRLVGLALPESQTACDPSGAFQSCST